jgi:hypothetical protein
MSGETNQEAPVVTAMRWHALIVRLIGGLPAASAMNE